MTRRGGAVLSIGAGIVLAALCAAPLAAQSLKGPRLRVGVMDLSGTAMTLQTGYTPTTTTTTISIPPPAEFARGLTEMLTTALVESGRFVVLERKAIQQALSEQDFGASGRVNAETAPAIGAAVGAQVLVTGDITEFSYNKSSVGGNISILRSVTGSAERLKAMVALDIRLIDAVTGEVVFSKRVEGDASATGVAADLQLEDQQFGTAMGSQSPLGKASREAIEDAVDAIEDGMKNVPWTGRVVDVRDADVYINAGSDSGMRVGQELSVFAQGESLVDPETGLQLGTPDTQIGAIKITQVEEKYSVAQVVRGEGFARGHLLRIAGEGAAP
ncbi:MAG: CsgG/HfaB family protein [Gemmatimonadota bacterium]